MKLLVMQRKKEEEYLREVSNCIKAPEDFEEAFANGYFDEEAFEELIINYAESIKLRRQLCELY